MKKNYKTNEKSFDKNKKINLKVNHKKKRSIDITEEVYDDLEDRAAHAKILGLL